MRTAKIIEKKAEPVKEVLTRTLLPTPEHFAEVLSETLMMREALKERRLAALKISVLTNQAVDAINNLTQKMGQEGKSWKK